MLSPPVHHFLMAQNIGEDNRTESVRCADSDVVEVALVPAKVAAAAAAAAALTAAALSPVLLVLLVLLHLYFLRESRNALRSKECPQNMHGPTLDIVKGVPSHEIIE